MARALAVKEERGILEKETEARHRRRKGMGLENKCAVASEEVVLSECGDTGFVEVLMGLYPHAESIPGFVQGLQGTPWNSNSN